MTTRKKLWKNGGSTVRTISTTYDLLDNVTAVTDPDTNATFEYDGLNRLKRENYAAIGGAAAYAVVHTLDPLDRRTKRQVFLNGTGTANTTNDYTYDAFGRMTSVSQSGSGVAAKRVNIGYDNLGLVVSESSFNNTSGTGSPVVATTKQYDGLGRTSQIKQMSGVNTLAQFDYTYDALGRLASETSNNGSTLTTSYTYDQVSQLIAANRSDSVNESYAWDPVGNPVGTGYVIGANNRLLEDPQYVYTYDDEGNRTGKTPKAGGSATTYNWDYRNRLTSVSGATSSVEKYDAFDRRTISTSGGSSDFYLWDGSHIALEMTSTTAVKTRPLHGPAVDQVFAEEGTGGTRWMLTDIRSSVRGVTNNTGTVQNHITYDSFGAVTNESNPSATDTLFGYTGREFDAGVGMQNNRARWYDASARRWASEDPIGFAAGDANVTRYVGNGATNKRDPYGLASMPDDVWVLVPSPGGRDFRTVRVPRAGLQQFLKDNPGTLYHGNPNLESMKKELDKVGLLNGEPLKLANNLKTTSANSCITSGDFVIGGFTDLFYWLAGKFAGVDTGSEDSAKVARQLSQLNKLLIADEYIMTIVVQYHDTIKDVPHNERAGHVFISLYDPKPKSVVTISKNIGLGHLNVNNETKTIPIKQTRSYRIKRPTIVLPNWNAQSCTAYARDFSMANTNKDQLYPGFPLIKYLGGPDFPQGLSVLLEMLNRGAGTGVPTPPELFGSR